MIENIVKRTRGYNESTLLEKSEELGWDGWCIGHGAALNNLAQLMREEEIQTPGPGWCDPSTMWTVMEYYVGRKPLIFVVVWENGQTHAVLAVQLRGGKVIVYDPACGLVELSISSFPGYTAKYHHKKYGGFLTGRYVPAM